MKSRIIIADDHQVVRQGLRDMISRTTDLTVTGEAANGQEAEQLARSVDADLLILDIALPVRRGIQVLETLRAEGIALPILIFSMYPASQYLDYAKRAGANGFVGKDAESPELLRAIRRILTGNTAFPDDRRKAGDPTKNNDLFSTLSRRELEVLQGLVGGSGIQEIASSLDIRPQSVTTYRRRLLEKLGVGSNAELAALVTRHGY